MRLLTLVSTLALVIVGSTTYAQSNTSVRVEPGYFCALNKCMRFSNDLSSVSIQSRRPVSIKKYGLRTNPVISASTFSEIFHLALVQPSFSAGDR